MTEPWITDSPASEKYPNYTRANAGEVMPDPVTPLSASIGIAGPGEHGWRDAYVRFGAMDYDEFETAAEAGDTDAAEFDWRFAQFLRDHGSRGPNEWEYRSHTWGTNPDLPLAAVDRMRFAADADPRGLEPGDVLIAPYTDPAWTPLFVPAAAVVVDVGAQITHAVIVSRELGLPCVVSVTGATRTIPDGALVEVDGTAGTVTVLELPA